MQYLHKGFRQAGQVFIPPRGTVDVGCLPMFARECALLLSFKNLRVNYAISMACVALRIITSGSLSCIVLSRTR